MKATAMLWTLALPALAGAVAGEREDYLLRAAQRDMALFRELDADHDQALSRSEVQGVVDMQARFDDIDADRNGELSLGEMSRYLRLTYERPQPPPAAAPPEGVKETRGGPSFP